MTKEGKEMRESEKDGESRNGERERKRRKEKKEREEEKKERKKGERKEGRESIYQAAVKIMRRTIGLTPCYSRVVLLNIIIRTRCILHPNVIFQFSFIILLDDLHVNKLIVFCVFFR